MEVYCINAAVVRLLDVLQMVTSLRHYLALLTVIQKEGRFLSIFLYIVVTI